MRLPARGRSGGGPWDVAAVRDDHRRRFGAAFEASATGMATLTADGTVARSNAAYEILFKGFPAKEGARFSSCLSSVEAARFADALKSVVSGKETAETLSVTISTTHRTRYALLVISPVLSPNGAQVDYVLLQVLDRSRQRLAEERYSTLVHGATDAIVGADRQGRIVVWNEAAATMFGYTQDEISGKSIDVLVPPSLRNLHERGFTAAMNAAEPRRNVLNVVALHADGHEIPVQAAVSTSGSGETAMAFAIVRDVSKELDMLSRLRQSDRQLRDAERIAHMGSFEWDAGADVIYWSDELYRIYGLEKTGSAVTLAQFIEHVHPDDRKRLNEVVQRALSTGAGWSMDERIVRGDGEIRILSTSGEAIVDDAGTVTRLCGTCYDVTDRRRAEAELSESELRFRQGFEDAPIGTLLVRWDGEATITLANRAARTLLGGERLLSGLQVSRFVHPSDVPLLHEMLAGVAAAGSSPAQTEVRLRREGAPDLLALAAASRMDTESDEPAIVVQLEDVTERKRAEDHLRHRALHDPLTGLPNRDLLLDRLGGALVRARRSNTGVAVLFLDLDNFKLINDTVGHGAGDEMLCCVAERLTGVARGGDTAARVGGDEFVVVCEDVRHPDEILSLAHRLADAIAAPIRIGGSDFISTVSIGIALASAADERAEKLLRNADLAMYRAKQRGKNTIELFDEALRRQVTERVEIEREIRAGLERAEFVPYYQPVISLKTGRLVAFEALVRWQHPTRGLLLPAQFLSIAENAHLIGDLGAGVLQHACRQAAAWRKLRPRLTMAVNLSLRQLDGRFGTVLNEAIAAAGIPARALRLEVTESVLLEINGAARRDLNAIVDSGVLLGIDDFGTGYSSLVYLKRFPVRFLKIDRSFVDGLPDDPEDLAIVEAIARLAEGLNVKSVAEGVETAQQLDELRRLGCSYAQGRFIAPPAPAEDCASLFDADRSW